MLEKQLKMKQTKRWISWHLLGTLGASIFANFFYKKYILRMTRRNNGMTNLRVNYTSLVVKSIHVVFLLHFTSFGSDD